MVEESVLIEMVPLKASLTRKEKSMENLEIILLDFDKDIVDNFFYNELKLLNAEFKSSHFYDASNKLDLTFSQVESIQKILTPSGTASMTIKEIDLGINLFDIVILLSFDEMQGEITFNVAESEVFKSTIEESKINFKKMVTYLGKLKNQFNIPKIIIGYEPALDDDMKILEMTQNISYEEAINKYFENLK